MAEKSPLRSATVGTVALKMDLLRALHAGEVQKSELLRARLEEAGDIRRTRERDPVLVAVVAGRCGGRSVGEEAARIQCGVAAGVEDGAVRLRGIQAAEAAAPASTTAAPSAEASAAAGPTAHAVEHAANCIGDIARRRAVGAGLIDGILHALADLILAHAAERVRAAHLSIDSDGVCGGACVGDAGCCGGIAHVGRGCTGGGRGIGLAVQQGEALCAASGCALLRRLAFVCDARGELQGEGHGLIRLGAEVDRLRDGGEGGEVGAHVIDRDGKMHLEGAGLVCGGGEFFAGWRLLTAMMFDAGKRDVAGLHRCRGRMPLAVALGSQYLRVSAILPGASCHGRCCRHTHANEESSGDEKSGEVERVIERFRLSLLETQICGERLAPACIIWAKMPASRRLIYTACHMSSRWPHTHSHPHTHEEVHFQSSNTVRDVVIGMSDGLTVPFALAAGLSGAVNSTRLVVLAGLAEIAAGSIAMGLGGYLAARGDAEHYASERMREEREVVERVRDEEEEIYVIFEKYGVARRESEGVLQALKRRPQAWVDFMMQFELGLETPVPGRAWRSALTIALAYVAGGIIPLLPYMLLPQNGPALRDSVVITLAALTVFGAIKGRLIGTGWLRSALQTVMIGGAAAAAAFGLARWLSAVHP